MTRQQLWLGVSDTGKIAYAIAGTGEQAQERLAAYLPEGEGVSAEPLIALVGAQELAFRVWCGWARAGHRVEA